jgi:hypothetical protein
MWTTLSSVEATQHVLLIWKDIWVSNFILRTWGALRSFLGIEVSRFSQGISLSQQKYVFDL